MERRRGGSRRHRRLGVKFWTGGEKSHAGFTQDFSSRGIFITTNRPLPVGTRLRLEVEHEDGFVAEAEVTHSHQIAPELQRVKRSGMGVRFLAPHELVAPLVPDLGATGEATKAAAPASAEKAAPTASGGPPRKPTPVPPPRPPTSVYAVRLTSVEHLERVLERDIVQGALFVPTAGRVAVNKVVSLELHPPVRGPAPVLARARVVRFLEGRGDGGRSGIGVELLDPPAVVAALEEMAQALRTG